MSFSGAEEMRLHAAWSESLGIKCTHTCTWSCPLEIGSLRTDDDTRSEQGLCLSGVLASDSMLLSVTPTVRL